MESYITTYGPDGKAYFKEKIIEYLQFSTDVMQDLIRLRSLAHLSRDRMVIDELFLQLAAPPCKIEIAPTQIEPILPTQLKSDSTRTDVNNHHNIMVIPGSAVRCEKECSTFLNLIRVPSESVETNRTLSTDHLNPTSLTIAPACDICKQAAEKPSRIQCCQSLCCWSCGAGFIVQNGRCWSCSSVDGSQGHSGEDRESIKQTTRESDQNMEREQLPRMEVLQTGVVAALTGGIIGAIQPEHQVEEPCLGPESRQQPECAKYLLTTTPIVQPGNKESATTISPILSVSYPIFNESGEVCVDRYSFVKRVDQKFKCTAKGCWMAKWATQSTLRCHALKMHGIKLKFKRKLGILSKPHMCTLCRKPFIRPQTLRNHHRCCHQAKQ